MICTKFDWNWPAGSRENFKRFCLKIIFPTVFSPNTQGHDFKTRKFALHIFQEAFLQIWVFLAQWFARKFLNAPTVILYFRYYLPFQEGPPLFLKKICTKFDWNWYAGSGEFFNSLFSFFRYYLGEIEQTQGLFVPSLVKPTCSWPRGFEEVENVKSLRTDSRTDNGQSEKFTWTFRWSNFKIHCFRLIHFDDY
jgi:hypothetical protein